MGKILFSEMNTKALRFNELFQINAEKLMDLIGNDIIAVTYSDLEQLRIMGVCQTPDWNEKLFWQKMITDGKHVFEELAMAKTVEGAYAFLQEYGRYDILINAGFEERLIKEGRDLRGVCLANMKLGRVNESLYRKGKSELLIEEKDWATFRHFEDFETLFEKISVLEIVKCSSKNAFEFLANKECWPYVTSAAKDNVIALRTLVRHKKYDKVPEESFGRDMFSDIGVHDLICLAEHVKENSWPRAYVCGKLLEKFNSCEDGEFSYHELYLICYFAGCYHDNPFGRYAFEKAKKLYHWSSQERILLKQAFKEGKPKIMVK